MKSLNDKAFEMMVEKGRISPSLLMMKFKIDRKMADKICLETYTRFAKHYFNLRMNDYTYESICK